ncbi:MAG: tryptophan synthase subunit alpha [candidate division Zixibacteria bacterium]|nr:tryptophan synthase subunit alpha [candidate division Zixibacteria bacterium]
MNRISRLIAMRGRHKLLVPFFTSGYPKAKGALDLIRAGIDAGADMIEIGMPFSDPMADGPEIQLSSGVALSNGINMTDTLRLVEAVRRYSDIPLVLMGYFNPIFAFGINRFAKSVSTCGADGLIIPDLPFDEADELSRSAVQNNLSCVYLIAPTSSAERVEKIDRACTDFVYAVTVTGVTGAGTRFDRSTDSYLKSLRQRLKKPFVAGFGVSSPASAARLARYADGVVIGSALIRAFRLAKNQRSGLKEVSRLLGDIRHTLD